MIACLFVGKPICVYLDFPPNQPECEDPRSVTGIAAAGTQLDGSTLIGNKRYYAGQIT
jgi:hypothetical protein